MMWCLGKNSGATFVSCSSAPFRIKSNMCSISSSSRTGSQSKSEVNLSASTVATGWCLWFVGMSAWVPNQRWNRCNARRSEGHRCALTTDSKTIELKYLSSPSWQHASESHRQWFCFQNKIKYFWLTLILCIFILIIKLNISLGWPTWYIGSNKNSGHRFNVL